jgi:hypothetical protein
MSVDSVQAFLADGTTVEIRPAVAGDFDAMARMHRAMSPDNSVLLAIRGFALMAR